MRGRTYKRVTCGLSAGAVPGGGAYRGRNTVSKYSVHLMKVVIYELHQRLMDWRSQTFSRTDFQLEHAFKSE